MTDARPITRREYWNALWRDGRPLAPIDPYKGGLRNYAYRHLHRAFAAALVSENPAGKSLIEIGCGGSRWLPYFHRIHGCRISGIDYSPEGCAATKALMNRLGIDGNIIEGDFLTPPADQLGRFDIVLSNGLVEHFSDTAAAVAACAAFLAPGGLMITLVPNMTGPLGRLQKLFDGPLYAKHVPLSSGQLAQAHGDAGMTIISSSYALIAHLGVLQFGAVERALGSRPLQVLKIALSGPFWALGACFGLRPNRITSPFVLCLARKPEK
ncbi:MAG: class I SAM-dependent methyltransferase [Alphaproteobacteria bacterium]